MSAQVRAEASLLALVTEADQAGGAMRADHAALLRHRASVIDELESVVQDAALIARQIHDGRSVSEAPRARVLSAGKRLHSLTTPPCPVDTFTVLEPLVGRIQDVTKALLDLTIENTAGGVK